MLYKLNSSQIVKSKISQNDLDLINKFTLNKLTENEIFTFSVALCSNEIDRDFESFTEQTIEKLAKMFIGKTGIFDHRPNAANQSARIFKTQVDISPNELTSFGERKVVLKATAYMVKCNEFENIIKKINAGILKEVSISCQIGQKICSVCGKTFKNGCNHQPGKTYNNKLCFLKLTNPIDAYEWSFVPIPAQPGAQTIKHFINVNKKNSELVNDAIVGKQQTIKLKKQVLKLGFLCGFDQNESKNSILNCLVEKMNFGELEQLQNEFKSILLNKNFNNMFSKNREKLKPLEKEEFESYRI